MIRFTRISKRFIMLFNFHLKKSAALFDRPGLNNNTFKGTTFYSDDAAVR